MAVLLALFVWSGCVSAPALGGPSDSGSPTPSPLRSVPVHMVFADGHVNGTSNRTVEGGIACALPQPNARVDLANETVWTRDDLWPVGGLVVLLRIQFHDPGDYCNPHQAVWPLENTFAWRLHSYEFAVAIEQEGSSLHFDDETYVVGANRTWHVQFTESFTTRHVDYEGNITLTNAGPDWVMNAVANLESVRGYGALANGFPRAPSTS